MIVKFKKLSKNAVAPLRATEGAAGWDVVATGREWNARRGVWEYQTGLAVEIPPGYVGLAFQRSSVYKTGQMLTNAVGVIDSDYRGEIGAKFTAGVVDGEYQPGDRIFQLVIMPVPAVEFIEVEDLSETERGAGGYGSTGR